MDKKISSPRVVDQAKTFESLAHSSSSIQNNPEELKSQVSLLISVSKKLLTKYGRREFTDNILI